MLAGNDYKKWENMSAVNHILMLICNMRAERMMNLQDQQFSLSLCSWLVSSGQTYVVHVPSLNAWGYMKGENLMVAVISKHFLMSYFHFASKWKSDSFQVVLWMLWVCCLVKTKHKPALLNTVECYNWKVTRVVNLVISNAFNILLLKK